MARTDQRSLKYFLEQRLVASEHQKWLIKLLGYDFDIVYKPRLENKAADALSRMHQEVLLLVISVPTLLSIPDLLAHVATGPFLAKILQEIKAGTHTGGYSLSKGVLKFKGRLVIAATSPFNPALVARISQRRYWGSFRRVQNIRAACTRLVLVGLCDVTFRSL